MILDITGRHFEINGEIKEYVQKKSQKLNKYSNKIVELRIIIEPNKHLFKAEAVVIAGNINLFAETKTSDLYSSIDGALDKIERQLARFKDKITDKHQAMKSKNAKMQQVESVEEIEEEETDLQ